jgi:hypothetical protein
MSRPTAQGWPFLVGRGRRRGYSTLLAPDFLVEQETYGILEEAVDPSSAGEAPQAVGLTLPAGHRLTVVYAVHRVTAADLGEDAPDPVDEHSRPLRVMYGFVCAGSSGPSQEDPAAAEADLGIARGAALDRYRRFLASAEQEIGVEPSAAYPLRSRLVDAATVPGHAEGPVPSWSPGTPYGGAGTGGAGTGGAGMGRAGRGGAPARTVRNLLIAGFAGLICVVLLIMWLRPDERECPPPDPKATAKTTVRPTTPQDQRAVTQPPRDPAEQPEQRPECAPRRGG